MTEQRKTLAVLGKELGVSRESVRQMDLRAKNIMRDTIAEAISDQVNP